MNKEKELIENFVSENFRAPSYKEYKNLGGTLNRYYFYGLRNSLGFSKDKGTKTTYEVLENDEVIFTGTSREIVEEFGTTMRNINALARYGMRLRKKYYVRKKVF